MICISLVNKGFRECLDIVKKEPLVEVRLDKLDLGEKETAELFRAGSGMIAACRKGTYAEESRGGLLKVAVDSGATYVDMDLETDEAFRGEIIDLAKKKGCQVIISYHNFDYTPAYPDLVDLARRCMLKGAAIAKIACMVRSRKDVIRLLTLYDLDMRLIALGMGETGKITRVAAPYLGAEFTYASCASGLEAAPGQIPGDRLKEIYDLLKGNIKY